MALALSAVTHYSHEYNHMLALVRLPSQSLSCGHVCDLDRMNNPAHRYLYRTALTLRSVRWKQQSECFGLQGTTPWQNSTLRRQQVIRLPERDGWC